LIFAVIFGLGAAMLSGTAPVIAGSAIGLCQVVQVFCLFNMNRHEDFDKFSQSFQISKLDFKFLDITGFQDSLGKSTNRNLASNGYKDLSNIRLDTKSFLVNYIYWFFVVIFLIIFHGTVVLLSQLDCIKKREFDDYIKKTLRAIRNAFEYGVYFYLTMATSLFIWICVMSEIAAGKMDTGLNGLSYLLSLFILVCLFAIMLFPVLMVTLEYNAKIASDETQDEIDEEKPKTFFAKIWTHYQYGVRKTIPAQLFYTTLQLKYF
jgi:hypothetical protein